MVIKLKIFIFPGIIIFTSILKNFILLITKKDLYTWGFKILHNPTYKVIRNIASHFIQIHKSHTFFLICKMIRIPIKQITKVNKLNTFQIKKIYIFFNYNLNKFFLNEKNQPNNLCFSNIFQSFSFISNSKYKLKR